jgi:peptide chain release factor 1
MALEESKMIEQKILDINEQIEQDLIPKDKNDDKNIIVEMRAGAGGDESTLFAAELFRAYSKFADKHGLKIQIISSSKSDVAGFKEIIFEITGRTGAYKLFKYESGVHRVQRVPDTEKAGRVHTSTITVAVLPEIEEQDFSIDPKDLNIEATTSSGHGGQSVNTTYSAVRMTHIPTGIKVSIQNERSQAQNREIALKIIQAKLKILEEEKLQDQKKELRGEFKSAEWGNQIRSYVLHPYKLVKDHRTGLESSDPDTVLNGELEEFIEKTLELKV